MKNKTAIILINVGTPENYSVSKVRKYLSEFLNDYRVINLPWLLRKILVNFIIVPFRARKSAKLYNLVWTSDGSPLLVYAEKLKKKLQTLAGDNYIVEIAMNYQHPNIVNVVEKLLSQNMGKIIFFPLFPQYASSTVGSIAEKILGFVAKQKKIPDFKFISQFYNNPFYIDAFVKKISEYNLKNFDMVLFSYHGLPLSQVYEAHYNEPCEKYRCISETNNDNYYCYHSACYATTRLLAEKLLIPTEKYQVCFQSRIAKKWLSPFTDEVIKECAAKGVKKLLIICPSFTADCLETIVEINHEYKELFFSLGGNELVLVESLNDSDDWAKAILNMINTN